MQKYLVRLKTGLSAHFLGTGVSEKIAHMNNHNYRYSPISPALRRYTGPAIMPLIAILYAEIRNWH